MDRLSDRERNNYLYARAMVGRDLRNIRGSAATNGFGTLRS